MALGLLHNRPKLSHIILHPLFVSTLLKHIQFLQQPLVDILNSFDWSGGSLRHLAIDHVLAELDMLDIVSSQSGVDTVLYVAGVLDTIGQVGVTPTLLEILWH